jgi:hypothetical protein
MRSPIALLIVVVLGVEARPVVAQVSIGISGVYADPNGSDFDGTNAGYGLQGQIRFPLGSSFSLGLGGQWTSHGIQGISENLSVVGAVAEPRYSFSTSSTQFKPYLTGSVSYVHESLSSGGNSGSANGFFFGGGAGVLIHAGNSVNVDLSGFIGPLNFGDVTVNGTKISGSSTSGTGLEFRAGVLLDLAK